MDEIPWSYQANEISSVESGICLLGLYRFNSILWKLPIPSAFPHTVTDHIKQLASGTDLVEDFTQKCKKEEAVSAIITILFFFNNHLYFKNFIERGGPLIKEGRFPSSYSCIPHVGNSAKLVNYKMPLN